MLCVCPLSLFLFGPKKRLWGSMVRKMDRRSPSALAAVIPGEDQPWVPSTPRSLARSASLKAFRTPGIPTGVSLGHLQADKPFGIAPGWAAVRRREKWQVRMQPCKWNCGALVPLCRGCSYTEPSKTEQTSTPPAGRQPQNHADYSTQRVDVLTLS